MTPDERGDLLHERDGDFNPGWLLVIAFAVIAGGGCIVLWAKVWTDGSVALALIAAVLTAFVLVVFVTGVYSLGRLKVLHGSGVLGRLAGALGGREDAPPAPETPVRLPRPVDLEDRP